MPFKRSRSLRSAAVLALLVSSLAAGAANASPHLTVAIDHAERLNLARPAGSVIVGNPAVADVTVVDGHTLFVSGRGYGVSQVIVLDPLGRTIWQGDVTVAAPEEGQVSVYRGTKATEMACSGYCSPTIRAAAKDSAPGGSGASGAASGGAASGGASGAINPALPAPAGAPQVGPMTPG